MCNTLIEAHSHVEIAISADLMFSYRRLQNQMTKVGLKWLRTSNKTKTRIQKLAKAPISATVC